jgi:xanthine dehydrogenase accessory factor
MIKDWQIHIMKEITQIVEAYQQIDFQTQKAALATVVRVEGSSYRRTGARMLVTDSGEWIGGISGGCLEGDALKRARLSMAQNKASLVTYDTSTDDPFQIGVGLGCNGIIDVLLTPLSPDQIENPVSLLVPCLAQRSPNVVVTVVKMIGEVAGITLGDAYRFDDEAHLRAVSPLASVLLADILGVLANQKSATRIYTIDDAMVTVFIEFLPPAMHLLVYGGNYDVYPMVRIAKEVGWKVSVFCNPQKVLSLLHQIADEVRSYKTESPAIDEYTAAILMAHDYETDKNNLLKLLQTDIQYIGMLGPKKRTDKMFKELAEKENPILEQDIPRIATPVGLDIGATTPEEIAISVIAEIRSIYAKRDGKRLKFREKPIYE